MWSLSGAARQLLAQSHTMSAKLEVLHNGERVYTLAPHAGSVSAVCGRAVMRKLSATVVDPTGRLGGGDIEDLLSPYDCEVAPYRGVKVGRQLDGTALWEWVPQGVFGGVGAKYPTVVSDGVPKARRQTLTVETDKASEWAVVSGLIEADSTLLLRDPFGDFMYCRIAGDINRRQTRKPARPEEVTPWRHSHITTLPLVEVEPPLVLDVGYTIPPGPVTPTPF